MAFGWGIVGTGAIAHRFAADLAHVPQARLAAVQSRSPQAAADFCAKFSAGRACADLDALLADGAVDAVYLATPNARHAEQALASIAAGKPVLVEKPLALSAADAERIEAAAVAKGVFAMEGLWTRFLPAVRRAKALVDAGEIGPITALHANLAYVHEETPESRFYDPQGGGALFDLGVYPISLALHFLGVPDGVSGSWKAARSGVDRSAEITLRYRQATAHLSCGFDREGDNSLTLHGSKGSLRLAPPFLQARRLTHFKGATPPAVRIAARGLAGRIIDRLPLPGRVTEHHPFPGSGLQFEAAAVMEAVRQKRTHSEVMPLADSKAALAIITKLLSLPPG